MNGAGRRWVGRLALPIRLWLAASAVLVVLVPAVTMVVLATRFTPTATIEASVLEEIVDNVALWNDPAWQVTARARLAAFGLDALLLDGEGREVFRTDAVPLLPGLGGGADGALVAGGALPRPPIAANFDRPRHLQRLVILDRGTAATRPGGARAIGTAYIFAPVQIIGWPGVWLVPAGGLVGLVVVLTAVTWFVGRAVLRPLDTLRRSADQIAAGSLEVDLPTSPVREMAEMTAAFGLMRDALGRAAEHEARLDAERRLFIGAIAHDLRTPLFALRGYLDGLAEGVAATPEKAARYLAVCRQQAATLERRVADLFAYARVEYLEEAPRRDLLDLGVVLRGAVDALQPRATERTTALTLAGPATPCWVEGEAHLLARAVENLLDNALRYTPAGGEVRIAWGPVAGQAVVTVTDSGSGIAPEDLPHLFTPLYRGEASRNRQTGGAGLGLTIARRILRAHDGDLTAANAAGRGAVFTLTLPAAGQATPRPPRPAEVAR